MKTTTLIGVGVAAVALLLLFGRRTGGASIARPGASPLLTTSNPAQEQGRADGAFLDLTMSNVAASNAPAIQFGAGPAIVGTQPSPFTSW